MNTDIYFDEFLENEVLPSSWFYSPSTGGFYTIDVHTDIPADAVEITAELHQELLEAQSNGKIIMPPDDEHPLPWASEAPEPVRDETMIKAELASLDVEYLTARTLAGLAAGDEVALSRWQEHEVRADILRAELAGLQEI